MLGRAVTVGGVDFKPWSRQLTVNQLTIARQNAADPNSASSACV